ncbi:hypothetical protein ASPNIDRAFT_43865 [Aspergillus niger ATCC 1015]|uniref:Uncharacterized protein n=1 Tax=Aspergillus niger (strain ATCC 1015 / CBS 113.46 / FGSC A1144 / LSHB Ac4 / NCTC 3858a / NRRL 328 / USDA 3528.7) TaxID=380704 RepID=G3XU92_ASPNA|nr:hypothetical protein ASPNIDRAFT_43865 [Aspergillus niger ATCC 1015]
MPDQQPLSPLVPRSIPQTTIPNIVPHHHHHHSSTRQTGSNSSSPRTMHNRLPPLMLPGASPRLSTLEPFTTTTSPSTSFPSPSSSATSDPLADILRSTPDQHALNEEQTLKLWHKILVKIYPPNGGFTHDLRTAEINGARIICCLVKQITWPRPGSEPVSSPMAVILCKGADEYHRKDTWDRTSNQLSQLSNIPGQPWCAVAYGCKLVCMYRCAQKFEGLEMFRTGSWMFDVGFRNGRVLLKQLLDDVKFGKWKAMNNGRGPKSSWAIVGGWGTPSANEAPPKWISQKETRYSTLKN